MKAGEIVDVAIEYAGMPLIIELPNGIQMVTTDYYYGRNKKDEPVLVIQAGRKLTK